MDIKHINNTTEASSEEILNNCTEPNLSNATMNTVCCEKTFDAILNNIKEENDSLFHDKPCDLEDSASIAYKFIDNKNKKQQQDEMCELASTSNEKDVYVSESNLQEHTDSKLDDTEPSLCVNFCLCYFCWKDLKKTNRKEELFSEKKSGSVEHCVKKNVSKYKNQTNRCSINLRSQPYPHKISVDECENIEKIFLTFESCHLVFIQPTKQTTDLKFPFYLSEIHNSKIIAMSVCQICGDKLSAPFNTDDWSKYEVWNCILIENNLPLILKPGMFVCVTCKGHFSKTNPGFPTIDLPRLREHIIKSNTIRLKFYGESQYNLSSVCEGSTNVTCPKVVPKIKENKESVHLTKVKFSDPLVLTTNCNFEIGHHKNDTESTTSSALLNVAEQNLCSPKLEPKDEALDFIEHEEEYYKTFITTKHKSKLPEQNPSANLTDNNVSNNFFNVFSYPETNYMLRQDDNKDLLNQSKNQYSKIPIYEGINKSDNIGSCQVVSGHNEIENNQSKLNSHAICSVADISRMDRKEAVKPSNAIDPISKKRKQRNFIWNNIYNKYGKKQKLDEKYGFYENNSTDKTTKFYSNKRTLKKNPCFGNKEKSLRQRCVKIAPLDEDISDSDSLSDSIILSDSGSLSDSKILTDSGSLSDSEDFSETDSEEILSDYEMKETDYIVVDSNDNFNLDSDLESVNSELEIKSDSEEQYHKNISITEEGFNKRMLSTFEIVSSVQKGPDHKILLDGDKVIETTSWSEKGTMKYKIMTDIEIEPSGNKVYTCIIIPDNDDAFDIQVFPTLKINVHKGSDNKILLDGEEVVIKSESENRKAKYEIGPTGNKKSKCIIIFDDEKEFIDKDLSTIKIVSDIKKGSDCEMLLDDGIKVYDIECYKENKKINYITVTTDKNESFNNKGSQCTFTSNNEKKFNSKNFRFPSMKNVQKETNSVLLDDEKTRENKEKLYYEKVSDITKSKIIIDDPYHNKITNNEKSLELEIKYGNSFPCLELNEDSDAKQDTTQEYFKQIYAAIRFYFENTENHSLKQLYSQIGNDNDMLMYLMENFRMFYNGELIFSETADQFSKDYLIKQKTALLNYFGDPKDSVNASKPFIHPLSHIHKYSKRSSSNIEPLIIKDIMATTSTSTQSNTIASPKNNVAVNKSVGSKFNNNRTSKLLPICNSVSESRHKHQTKFNIQLPVAIKKKTVSKSRVLLPPIYKLMK